MNTLIGLTKSSGLLKINYVRASPTLMNRHLCQLIVFSCSNDTTIKVWSLKDVLLNADVGLTKRAQSMWNLNDDSDYVSQIDYSSRQGTLYSIADNGYVRQWDVQSQKILSSHRVSIDAHIKLSNRAIIGKAYGFIPQSSISLIVQYLHVCLVVRMDRYWQWVLLMILSRFTTRDHPIRKVQLA